MTSKEERLLALATSISDGHGVDWEEAEAGADQELQTLIHHLKMVARIAEIHKSPAAGDPDPDSGEGTPGPEKSEGNGKVSGGGDSSEERFTCWGHLNIIEKIGEGAFGEVFRAWDTKLDREVALKLYWRSDSERALFASALVEEGRLLARIRHSNVITVYGAERLDGRLGIWMEFINGHTLEELLRGNGPFGAREAILIGVDAARALAATHRAGLVHGDIKAQNVMREAGGRIILMDFGAGRDLLTDSGNKKWTLSGTPLYLAPELFEGDEVSVRTDIYSLGVLLHYLVTGAYPVVGGTLEELRVAHGRKQVRLLRDARPDLPEAFLQVVERATERKPERRYESAGALEASLAKALGVADVREEPFEIIETPHRRNVFWQRTGLALAAGVLFAIGTAWVLPWLTREEPKTAQIALPPVETEVSQPEAGQSAAAVAAVSPVKEPSAAPAPAAPPATSTRESGIATGRVAPTTELENLAALHQALGSYQEAKSLFEQSLTIAERELGPEQPEVAHRMMKLAWVLEALGSKDQARALHRRALDIYKKSFSPDHPYVAASRASLASLGGEGSRYDASLIPLAPTHELVAPKPSSLATLGQEVLSQARSYEIEAAVYRRSRGITKRLLPGGRVAPGDKLFLEIKASEDLHVYILNEDDQGESYLLFPLPGQDLTNPLSAGATHHLPGPRDGKQLFWQVTSAGGREHFLIVTSPTRLEEFEAELQALAVAQTGQPLMAARLSESTVGRLRGIGGLAEDTRVERGEMTNSLFQLAGELPDYPELARGAWIRQLDLENPIR